VATECSQNDGSKTQYYVVILDRLQGRSGALERALESRIRGPLTVMDTINNKSRWNTYRTTQTRTSTNNRKRNTRTNQENPNKRTRSNKTIRKKRRAIMERKRNCLHRWQDLRPKKQTTSGQNTQRQP